MTTDELLERLVAKLAVTETMMLHLAAYLANGADEPGKAALALLADIKAEFLTGAPGLVGFEAGARAHLDRLEPRLLRLVETGADQ